MKELKFNLRYLLKRQELYFAIIAILIICLFQAGMVVFKAQYIELEPTSEYLFILTNTDINLNPIIILVLPVIGSLILSDSSWLELNRQTDTLLYMRLDYRKNIIIRWILSIAVTFIIVFIGLILNYLTLRFIFGSGNKIVIKQSMAYNLMPQNGLFLENIRMSSPTLFAILSSLHVSFLLGLLSGISYCMSFYIRQRLVIYFQILLLMFIYEIISANLGFGNISIINQLQIMNFFTISDVLILYGLLIIISGLLLGYYLIKRR